MPASKHRVVSSTQAFAVNARIGTRSNGGTRLHED